MKILMENQRKRSRGQNYIFSDFTNQSKQQRTTFLNNEISETDP